MSELKAKERVVESLSDLLKAKISEIHLKMISGTMNEKELNEARTKLADLRTQLAGQLRTTEAQTSRREKQARAAVAPPDTHRTA